MVKIKFGEYLINNKKINANQLNKGPLLQKNQLTEHYRMLGEILVYDTRTSDEDEMFSMFKCFYEKREINYAIT